MMRERDEREGSSWWLNWCAWERESETHVGSGCGNQIRETGKLGIKGNNKGREAPSHKIDQVIEFLRMFKNVTGIRGNCPLNSTQIFLC